MKKRIIAVLLVLLMIVSPLSFSVKAENTYENATIRVNLGQAIVEKEVIIDKGAIFAPLSWLTYFGLMDKTESNNEFEFFYPEQKSVKQYAKRIFISKSNPHSIFVGYYYNDEGLLNELASKYSSFSSLINDAASSGTAKEAIEKFFAGAFSAAKNNSIKIRNNYKALYEGEFSRCIESNNELFFPIEELLPLINAKTGVSGEGDLCISINNSSVLRALYGSNVGQYVFSADQCVSKGKTFFDTTAWVTSTFWNRRFDRLDFIYKTGEINDYQSIFEQMLLDDEVYLQTQSEKGGKSEAELGNELLSGVDTAFSLLKKLNISVRNTGIDNAVFDDIDFLTQFNNTLYKDMSNIYDSSKLKGLSKKVGYVSDIYDYWYTYNYQVEDHRRMLGAVYNYALRNGITNMDLYSSGTAAKSVEAQYSDSFSTAVLAKLGDTFFDKAIGKLSSNAATEKLFGTLTTSISLTTSIMKWNDYTKNALKTVDDAVMINYYDVIADTAYDVFSNLLYNEQFDSNNLETLRLSAILTLTASKYGYSSSVFGKTYKNEIAGINELLRKLYEAADGTECEGSDYYENEKTQLSEIIQNLHIRKNSQKPSETPTNNEISEDLLSSGVWVVYSPQAACFDMYKFNNGIVEIGCYGYRTAEISAISSMVSRRYTISNNSVVISEKYGDFIWNYTFEDKLTRSYKETLAESPVECTEYMYHYVETPSLEIIKRDCIIQPDLIKTIIDEDSPKSSGSIRPHFSIPQITVDSSDVNRINEKIMSIYQSCYDAYESYSIKYYADKSNNYLCVVLEIIIEQSDFWDYVAFTIDLNTGKQLNVSDLLGVFSINRNEFEDEMNNAVSIGFKYSENSSKEIVDLFIWKGKLYVLGVQELSIGTFTSIYDYQERDFCDSNPFK